MADTSHLLLLGLLVFAQGFLHFPEHIAQFIQRFYPGAPASGIIGQLNVEWVHLVYNWGLLFAMIPLMVGCGFFTRGNAWQRYNYTAWAAVVGSFWIQVWHAFEHYGKLAQYYRNLTMVPAVVPPDGPNAPGLVGYWLFSIWGPSALADEPGSGRVSGARTIGSPRWSLAPLASASRAKAAMACSTSPALRRPMALNSMPTGDHGLDRGKLADPGHHVGIAQHGGSCHSGRDLLEQLEPFRGNRVFENR